MTTPISEQDSPLAPETEAGPGPGRHRLTFGLAAAVLLASFGVWGYAYSGAADRDAPDLLADDTFSTRAEDICADALADVEAMPSSLTAADGAERATQIVASTDRLSTMVDDLEALVGGDDRDVEIQTGWLGDWRTILSDRYAYAEAIAADPDSVFLLTDTGVGERLDRRITRMATTNSMISCQAPQDVG